MTVPPSHWLLSEGDRPASAFFAREFFRHQFRNFLLTNNTICHIMSLVKYYDWNKTKNELLRTERDISFEEVYIAIESGGLLEVIEHPNPKKYPNQKVFVVSINNYVYLVPFVEDEEKVFLKTIIPSRKATKKYLIKGGDKR